MLNTTRPVERTSNQVSTQQPDQEAIGLDSRLANDSEDGNRYSTAFGPESQHRTPLGDVTEIEVDGVKRPTLNADGNKIHWSREGVENFWRWIDGTNAERLGRASKVGSDDGRLSKPSERNPYVAAHTFDKLGRPRVFFHGSASDFAAFNFDHADRKDQGWLGRGAYVTSDPEVANTYSRLKRDMGGDGLFGMGTGQGYSVRGASSKRAMGSEKGVVDILANIAMQRERAIVRVEKNRVAQALYGLAIQNPNADF